MTARVTVTINGRHYQIACDDGQEQHLMRLAELVDKRVAQLVAAVGQVGDAQLLVMASLVVADELMEAQAETAPVKAQPRQQSRPAIDDQALVDQLQAVSLRIESLADRLERP